jgi:hypothetical protein
LFVSCLILAPCHPSRLADWAGLTCLVDCQYRDGIGRSKLMRTPY